ncbi:MAG TPA: hypothetical protein VFT72_18145 [Opitutaceae bacterium]|nr:hypothetical protein [Opitutaceae bacterium]
MTFHFTSPTVEGSRKFRATSIGLFALLAGANAHAVCVQHRNYVYTDWSQSRLATDVPREEKPLLYLPTVGVVPLRFAPPPPVATERPKKIAPVAEIIPVAPPKVEPVHVEPPHEVAPPPKEEPAPTGPTPPRILPDDTPRDLRAEDVLPYFQLSNDPAPSSGVSVPFTPATPAQPQSSATYQLK